MLQSALHGGRRPVASGGARSVSDPQTIERTEPDEAPTLVKDLPGKVVLSGDSGLTGPGVAPVAWLFAWALVPELSQKVLAT